MDRIQSDLGYPATLRPESIQISYMYMYSGTLL